MHCGRDKVFGRGFFIFEAFYPVKVREQPQPEYMHFIRILAGDSIYAF